MDKSNALLNLQLQTQAQNNPTARILIWADDSFELDDFNFTAFADRLTVICNRADHEQALKQLGVKGLFSDFDSTELHEKFDLIFYRVSKERLVTHHCLNQSRGLLKPGAQLILVGRKEDGIKTYKDKAIKQLGFNGGIKKHKDCYTVDLALSEDNETISLDTNDFELIRQVGELSILNKPYALYSKPGVYGWKKIDPGSGLLIETLINEQATLDTTSNALDLGCGSGLLTLALDALGLENITSTDNSAAAILAVQKTCDANNIKANIIAADCGANIDEKFTLIVCNPPFHKSFDTSKALTEKFVKTCKRLLAQQGTAYFVTNAFIGIEKLFSAEKLNCTSIINNAQFKVLKVEHKRH